VGNLLCYDSRNGKNAQILFKLIEPFQGNGPGQS
jgi:hypothetical protein